MGFFRRSGSGSVPSTPNSRGSHGQGASPAAPPPPPPAPGLQRIGVKVPPGMRPGMEIQFPTPQGPRFKAVIPPGVLEGSVFLVEVPIPQVANGVATAPPTPRAPPPQPPTQSSSGSLYPPFTPVPGGDGAYATAPAAARPDGHRLARAPSNQMEEEAELQAALVASRSLQAAQQEEEELQRVLAESSLSAASENGAPRRPPLPLHPGTAAPRHRCTPAPLHPSLCQASGRSASERRPSGMPSSAGGAPSSTRRRSAAQPPPPPPQGRRRWIARLLPSPASTQAPIRAAAARRRPRLRRRWRWRWRRPW